MSYLVLNPLMLLSSTTLQRPERLETITFQETTKTNAAWIRLWDYLLSKCEGQVGFRTSGTTETNTNRN